MSDNVGDTSKSLELISILPARLLTAEPLALTKSAFYRVDLLFEFCALRKYLDSLSLSWYLILTLILFLWYLLLLFWLLGLWLRFLLLLSLLGLCLRLLLWFLLLSLSLFGFRLWRSLLLVFV